MFKFDWRPTTASESEGKLDSASGDSCRLGALALLAASAFAIRDKVDFRFLPMLKTKVRGVFAGVIYSIFARKVLFWILQLPFSHESRTTRDNY